MIFKKITEDESIFTKRKVETIYLAAEDTSLQFFVLFKGEFEDSYFSIMFINGILFVSISEREMLLQNNTKAVGTIQYNDNLSFDYLVKVSLEFIKKYSGEDKISNLLDDIIDFLGWECNIKL